MIDKASLNREILEISQLAELPQHLRNVIIENKKMAKRIFILEAQLSEKNSIIEQLKEQLDSTVIEQTQLKLSTIRNIEHQVAQKVNEVKHKYIEKDAEMQGQIDGLREMVGELKASLQQTDERQQHYLGKIDSLKQYIVEALEEKDYLIGELGKIINEQERRIEGCSFCSRTVEQICREGNKAGRGGRKMPYIARNE